MFLLCEFEKADDGFVLGNIQCSLFLIVLDRTVDVAMT